MNNDVKSILASKTIWGLVIAAAPVIAQALGYQLSAGFSDHATALVDQLITLGGLAFSAYGRIVATKALVSKKQ